MPAKRKQPDNSETPNIRRGSGLRLSTHTPLPTEPESGPPAERATPPTRRGAALRLSTHAPVEPELATPPAPVKKTPPVRAKKAPPAPVEKAPPAPVEKAPPAPVEKAPPAPVAKPGKVLVPPPPLIDTAPLIRYREAGSGPPLLLIHGWSGTSLLWQPILSHLTDIRHCYAPDLPGFGATPALPTSPDLPAAARMVLAFADRLGLEHFDIVGHSFGAAIAAYLAAHWPTRVGRIALTSFGLRRFAPDQIMLSMAQTPVSLTTQLWGPVLSLWQPMTRMVMQLPPFSVVLANWLINKAPVDPELWNLVVADLMAINPPAYLAALLGAGATDLPRILSALEVPTLFVSGGEDRLVTPTEVRAGQILVRNSRLLMLEGYGHLPMIEQGSPYGKAIRDFLLE